MQHGGTKQSRMLSNTHTHLTVYSIWRGVSDGDFEYSAHCYSVQSMIFAFLANISESSQNVNPLALTSV